MQATGTTTPRQGRDIPMLLLKYSDPNLSLAEVERLPSEQISSSVAAVMVEYNTETLCL